MPPSRRRGGSPVGRLQGGIAVHGLKEALALLEFAPDHVDEEIREELYQAARPAYRAVLAASPAESGRLHESIKIRSNTRKGRVGVGIKAGGARAPYAGVVMFGRRAEVSAHTRAGHAVQSYTRRLTPNPFLVREAQRHSGGVAERIQRALDRILGEVFK